MWDRVRDARLAPGRFATMVMRELPGEKDEQLLNVLLARLARTLNAYMPDSSREILASAENVLFERMSDTSASYGIRKAHLDALISVAATPNALTRLDALLDSAQAAGADLRAPTRWSIVTSLISRDWVSARSRLSREIMRDSTTEGRRRAFVANAAWPDATVKRAYFERYFADASLNEDWATASLRAFNVPAQDSLTLPFLATALDSLQWIQKHRRIFYLGSWLSAFVDGQRSADALARVNEFLRENPQLPTDLRQKILQNADELERTVRIRRQYPATQNLPAAGREVTELIGRTTWCAGAVPCTSPGAR
jgi:aminopeptidase N